MPRAEGRVACFAWTIVMPMTLQRRCRYAVPAVSQTCRKHPVVRLYPVLERSSRKSCQNQKPLLNSLFGWVPCPDGPWQQVIGIQHDLIKIGHNRGPDVTDILIALTAAQHRLTVLHLDNDFAAIAKVRPDIRIQRLE